MAKKKTPSPPSSLYHYTSSGVLLHILKNIIEEDNPVLENAYLNFHASESTCMNDMNENKIIRDKLGLQSNNLIQDFEEKIKTVPKIYVLSLGKYADSIPMWQTYGETGQGIALWFDFKLLKKFFFLIRERDIENISIQNPDNKYLVACSYISKGSIESIKQKFRDKFKTSDDKKIDLNAWQIASISFKDKSFEYENEYRIVAFSKNSKLKKGKYGLTEYIELKIPLKTLKGIVIGPRCSETTEQTIRNISQQIQEKYGHEIRVSKSKLSIR